MITDPVETDVYLNLVGHWMNKINAKNAGK